MLKMDQVHVLRHKVLKEGQSIRRVARELGLSRNTVAKYLDQPEPIRSSRQARERPVFCDPPGISVVPRGAIVGGKLCNGPWGCRCAHWFCPQCSTLPTGPLSCEWTTCAPLSRPPVRGR